MDCFEVFVGNAKEEGEGVEWMGWIQGVVG